MKCWNLILFFLLLIGTHTSKAQPGKPNPYEIEQQKKIDSLKQLVIAAPDDTLKINRLILISALQYDPENTLKDFSLQALSLAKKLHYKKGETLATNQAGSVYQVNKDYQTAISYYKKAISLSESYGFNSDETDFYPPLLNLYFYLGDYPNAMETISSEMITAEKYKDKKRIAHCNNILGYIYFKQEDFAAAEKYYGFYLDNAKELRDSTLLAHALGEVSDVYTQEKKYKESIDALFNSIRICEKLEANPAKNTQYTNALLPHYKSKAMYRLGVNYKLSGKLPEALYYALEAIKYANHISPPKYEIARYFTNAGDVYKELKDFKNAIVYLRFGFDLSREIQHRENTRDAAEYLSQTYAALQQYDSAFYFYRIYTGLKDSIVNNETKMKIAGIQGKYDIAQKDREIARQQQIRNILIGSFIFLLIVLVLLYNSYRLKQKHKYQKEINRQQNELFNAIVTTQDQERKRIAQDIHDSLGSVLSAAKLKLSSLHESKELLTPDELEKYQTSLDLLDEASSELRHISHNIMPATLSKLGLEAALQNLIDKIAAHSKMQIHFTAHGFDERLEESTEMSIYRIILELLNNIVKHADAEKVSIQIIKYPAYINLVIEDNGKGFDHAKAFEQKKGIGLGNILSRVEYMNGSMEIDSSAGKGTTVIIEIPYTT
ncbi:MAG: sensor histidine kinase [Ferruginibacter sp.]